MHGIALRAVPNIALLVLAVVAGCQSTPSTPSGMGKISTVTVNGSRWASNISILGPRRPVWRAIVISIRDEHGTEVYSIFKQRASQSSVDLPAGIYEIMHTCSTSQYKYEEMPGQWRFPKWTTRLRLIAGDSIKFAADGGVTLGGAMCEGTFFVPAGQLVQANRLMP